MWEWDTLGEESVFGNDHASTRAAEEAILYLACRLFNSRAAVIRDVEGVSPDYVRLRWTPIQRHLHHIGDLISRLYTTLGVSADTGVPPTFGLGGPHDCSIELGGSSGDQHVWSVLPSTRLYLHPTRPAAMLYLDNQLWFQVRGRSALYSTFLLLDADQVDLNDLVQESVRFECEYLVQNHLLYGIDTGWRFKPIPPSSWDDVILDAQQKQALRELVDFFFGRADMYRRWGIPYRRGVLLAGPPGTGKTLTVRTLAYTCGRPAVYWQINSTTTPADMRSAFRVARRLAPSLLILEDIDSIAESGLSRSEFLNELDGLTASEGIFIVATTNYPERVDPALIGRVGRFDRMFTYRLPDRKQRLAYIRRITSGIIDRDDLLEDIARLSEGLTLAHLNEVRTMVAMRLAAGQTVSADDISNLCDEMRRTEQVADKPGTVFGNRPMGFRLMEEDN
jgi:hypothetical protein